MNRPARSFAAPCCVVSIAIVLLNASCSGTGPAAGAGNRDPADSPAGGGKVVRVAVAKAGRETLTRRVTLAAEFRPDQEIDLHAKVAGYVKEIRVDVGDRVRQGQLIAVLEIPEFANELTQAAAARKHSEGDVVRARADVQRAQSVHDAAKLTYGRLAGVARARPELLAQQEVDDALARVQIAAAQLDTARAALAVSSDQVLVQEAGEARVKTMAEYSRITAPFAGIITKRFADKGAMIQAGTASQSQAMPLVRLSQIDHLRLVLPVPESSVPGIRVGRTVAVRVPSLGQTFEGRVARFSERVDSLSRTMETQVDVPNPRLLLKPGMYAFAEIELEQRPNAVTVPVQAIVRRAGKPTVMLVNAQHRLEVRDIAAGLETPGSVEVTSGVAEGDLVVIGNQSQLTPGLIVEARLSGPGSPEPDAAARGGR